MFVINFDGIMILYVITAIREGGVYWHYNNITASKFDSFCKKKIKFRA